MAYFETDDGRTGDTYAALRLIVDPDFAPDRPWEPPAAIDPFVVCAYPRAA